MDGGSLELEVGFRRYAASRNKTRPASSMAATVHVRRLGESCSSYTSSDARTLSTCDEEDGYSFDLRTENIFPAAKVIRRQQLTERRQDTEGAYSADLRTDLLFPAAWLIQTAYEVTKSLQMVTRWDEGGQCDSTGALCKEDLFPKAESECDSIGTYSSDVNTEAMFPPAEIIKKKKEEEEKEETKK